MNMSHHHFSSLFLSISPSLSFFHVFLSLSLPLHSFKKQMPEEQAACNHHSLVYLNCLYPCECVWDYVQWSCGEYCLSTVNYFTQQQKRLMHLLESLKPKQTSRSLSLEGTDTVLMPFGIPHLCLSVCPSLRLSVHLIYLFTFPLLVDWCCECMNFLLRGRACFKL